MVLLVRWGLDSVNGHLVEDLFLLHISKVQLLPFKLVFGVVQLTLLQDFVDISGAEVALQWNLVSSLEPFVYELDLGVVGKINFVFVCDVFFLNADIIHTFIISKMIKHFHKLSMVFILFLLL